MGGAEQSLLLLLEHLDRRRFWPALACNDGPLAEAARKRGVPTWIVDMPKIRRRPTAPWSLARGALDLVRLIRHEKIDIVHSNAMRASVYAAAAAQLARRPFVWHVRDIHTERLYLRLMRWLCDRAIAISRAVAAPIPCLNKVQVIYNGVDVVPFDRASGQLFRAEIDVGPDQPLVGIVGRVWPWKGHRQFLAAVARVAPRHPQARFVVVGDVLFPAQQNYLDELRAHTSELGLSDRVVFVGHRQDIPEVMAGLDLLVHASQAEPFGRVLIEAMAARRAVVAFADGGVPEIVVNGLTGLLVPSGDEAGLASAIDQLLMDPGRLRTMGRAGRRRVEQLFTVDQMARAVEAIYQGFPGLAGD